MKPITEERRLRESVLALCEWCGLEGPAPRLREHIEQDHPEFREEYCAGSWSEESFAVWIPGRFRKRLERIRAQTERSFGQIIGAALDAQGLGRMKRPGWEERA